MSQCMPQHDDEDIWVNLEHPGPQKPQHNLVQDETRQRQPERRVPEVPISARQQDDTRGRTLRRRSTLDQGAVLSTRDRERYAPTDTAARRRQEEDLAMVRAYQHANDLPAARHLKDSSHTDSAQQRVYRRELPHVTTQDNYAERTMPFTRPVRKDSSSSVITSYDTVPGQSTSGPTRRSQGFHGTGDHDPHVNRRLSALPTSRQEQEAALLKSLEDRRISIGGSSSYSARVNEAGHDYAPDYNYDPASVHVRSYLRPASSRPKEASATRPTPQVDHHAGLRHHVSNVTRSLKHMALSPALLRRAPPLTQDHSRHRSPKTPDDCGYCELEEPQRGAGVSPGSIPEDALPSPLESYHTAESYAAGAPSPRPLRRVDKSVANLRGSPAATTAHDSQGTVQPRSFPLTSTRTAVPSTAPRPAPREAHHPNGGTCSPQPSSSSSGVRQRSDQHASSQQQESRRRSTLADDIAGLRAEIKSVERKVCDSAVDEQQQEREEGIQTDGTLVLIKGITLTLHMTESAEDLLMRADLSGEGLGARRED